MQGAQQLSSMQARLRQLQQQFRTASPADAPALGEAIVALSNQIHALEMQATKRAGQQVGQANSNVVSQVLGSMFGGQ